MNKNDFEKLVKERTEKLTQEVMEHKQVEEALKRTLEELEKTMVKFTTKKARGWIDVGGTRMNLVDIPGGWYSIKRLISLLAGSETLRRVMVESGNDERFTLSALEVGFLARSRQGFIDAVDCYSEAGFGDFKVKEIDFDKGYALITCKDSFEGWTLRKNDELTKESTCDYSRGVLLSFMQKLTNKKGLNCVETQCIGTGAEECRFVIDEEQRLLERGLELPTLGKSIKEKAEEFERLLIECKKAEEELKQAQAQLIQSEKLAAAVQIASEAAHEVKNPLAVIKAGLYYLGRILPENKEAQKTISQMDKATQRAVAYIDDLLNFSRPPVLNLKPVDLHKVIEDSFNELPQEILAGIEIEKNFAPAVPLLTADPDRLKQVFVNLIKNGAEAMGEVKSKKLKVESEKEGEFVKIRISDTGKGMIEEDLKRIFDQFFTTKGKGTGLGLAICHRIIEAHKGGIEVKSEVGKGTTFVIKLSRII